MAHSIPKYAKPEFERRFLLGDIPDLSDKRFRLIEDLYLDGTRLRLRKITGQDRETQYKLCKKYPSESGEPLAIVNIYLTAQEHDLFSALPAKGLRKKRYNVIPSAFCIDVFEDHLAGLVLGELELESAVALETFILPPWVGRDVSRDPFFAGGNLASIDAKQLATKLLSLQSRT
ncbi:hypothetical protein [Rhizobium lusitanum]|uniref:CYTH domain-containing protein n=1 Tax=Rhizobium lusitanum TaxID=293958 RepID=A0A7X0IR79_9HYPH|nr:hypothetical protein [Rhizobium lusitanum]MBB6484502.1 CYTH domain-containing protein [Rhizobium lusitanum]